MDEHNKNFLLHDKEFVKKSCSLLAKRDRRVKKLLSLVGPPTPAKREYIGFASFANILISQQISAAAAASIIKKFLSLVGEVTPENILRHSPEALRGAGLSRQKIERIQLLAQATLDGIFQPHNLKKISTQEIIAHIVAQKGFGEWSGEIFALFSLGRVDVFPKGDLALQLAHQHLYQLKKRPTPKELEKASLAWTPYRSVVALMLWDYYGRVVKKPAKEQLAKK
ncbi:MAG: hypothetical protein QM529_05990 [Hydrotalea sp.]|nr:hypothetical protein [Hydrotalea sp.]